MALPVSLVPASLGSAKSSIEVNASPHYDRSRVRTGENRRSCLVIDPFGYPHVSTAIGEGRVDAGLDGRVGGAPRSPVFLAGGVVYIDVADGPVGGGGEGHHYRQ